MKPIITSIVTTIIVNLLIHVSWWWLLPIVWILSGFATLKICAKMDDDPETLADYFAVFLCGTVAFIGCLIYFKEELREEYNLPSFQNPLVWKKNIDKSEPSA
jgi:hypothetical protein